METKKESRGIIALLMVGVVGVVVLVLVRFFAKSESELSVNSNASLTGASSIEKNAVASVTVTPSPTQAANQTLPIIPILDPPSAAYTSLAPGSAFLGEVQVGNTIYYSLFHKL